MSCSTYCHYRIVECYRKPSASVVHQWLQVVLLQDLEEGRLLSLPDSSFMRHLGNPLHTLIRTFSLLNFPSVQSNFSFSHSLQLLSPSVFYSCRFVLFCSAHCLVIRKERSIHLYLPPLMLCLTPHLLACSFWLLISLLFLAVYQSVLLSPTPYTCPSLQLSSSFGILCLFSSHYCYSFHPLCLFLFPFTQLTFRDAQ